MSEIQLTRTKILVPNRPPSILSRPRLLELLDAMLDYQLVLVTAPAGYGKTSLLVDMAHQLEMPICWYSLDSLDQDPQRFFSYLISSIAVRYPEFGQRSLAALQDAGFSDESLDRLVSTVVNEVYEHVTEYFAIVLDDFHLVGDNRTVNRFISQFIQLVDENCHLVISSRALLTMPDLPLMVARSQVAGLGYEEMAFKAAEVQALVEQNYQFAMPDAAAQELVRETEGWITGLLLSTETMWQGMVDRVRLARASGVGLYDYLIQQVLNQQTPEVRRFLLRTSLLQEFNHELCAEFLGDGTDWQRLIDEVLRSNLFVLPVENQGTWLRYHHLFRDFLQKQLARENPDEERLLLQRLANLFVSKQEWERAYETLKRLRNRQALIELIRHAGTALLKSGRLLLLTSWLDDLTAEERQQYPELLGYRGDLAVMAGDAQRGERLLGEAQALFRRLGNREGLARTLVQRAMAYQFLGQYELSLNDADEALSLTEDDADLRTVRAGAERAKGIGLMYVGELGPAMDWLERSLKSCQAISDDASVALVQMELGLTHMNAGQYSKAQAYYENAISHWRKVDNVIHQASLLNNLGVLCHLQGDYEQALQHLEQSVDCAQQGGFARAEAAALASIGDLYAEVDALDAAGRAYGRAQATAGRINDHFLVFYIVLAQARLLADDGDILQAKQRLESALVTNRLGHSSYEDGLWHTVRGYLSFQTQDYLAAIEELELGALEFDKGGQYAEAARVRLLLGAAYHAKGETEAAGGNLTIAMQLAAGLESVHTLLPVGRDTRDFLAAMVEKPGMGLEARQLLERVDDFEQTIPSIRRKLRGHAATVEVGDPRLVIQAFGSVNVLIRERPVSDPDWQSRKVVREFFFLMLAHPDGLSKEAIGEFLWPDSTASQQKLSFKNTVYRVRRALGPEVVLFEGNLYRFNTNLDYSYDIEAFKAAGEQAQRASSVDEKAGFWAAMVQAYRGSYLPEADGNWVWPERERLNQSFESAIIGLAHYRFDQGSFHEVLELCHRALENDPCLEEAHRLVMQVHAARGNQAGVTRQYQRCQQCLADELSVSPSLQTTDLFHQLSQ